MIDAMAQALQDGGKVLVFGNGGSATQSSHFAAELVNKFYFRRPALPALALGADMANMTSIANDEEFARRFLPAGGGIRRQGRRGPGHHHQRQVGRTSCAAWPRPGKWRCGPWPWPGAAARSCWPSPWTSWSPWLTTDTPTIQEMHLFLLHVIAEAVEKKLFGGKHD